MRWGSLKWQNVPDHDMWLTLRQAEQVIPATHYEITEKQLERIKDGLVLALEIGGEKTIFLKLKDAE